MLVMNRNEIPAKYIESINVGGDGNCLFRCMSLIYFDKEDYHIFLCSYLYDYILQNYNKILEAFTYTEYKGQSVEIEEYIPKIKENGTYSGEIELSLLSKILEVFISVYVYKSNIFGTFYKSLNFYGSLKDKEKVIIILEYQETSKHYKIIRCTFNNNIISDNNCINENTRKAKNNKKEIDSNISNNNKYKNKQYKKEYYNLEKSHIIVNENEKIEKNSNETNRIEINVNNNDKLLDSEEDKEKEGNSVNSFDNNNRNEENDTEYKDKNLLLENFKSNPNYDFTIKDFNNYSR